MGTVTDSGLVDTQKVGITAGLDLSFTPGWVTRYVPSLEVRGTTGIGSGSATSLRDALVGPRLTWWRGALHPYADVLVGRGRVQYLAGGVVFRDWRYISSITTVYSPGIGVDFDVTPSFSAKVDAQYQFWQIPVVAVGSAHPLAVSAGVAYQFDFNHKVKE
jgi:hypothetical protein